MWLKSVIFIVYQFVDVCMKELKLELKETFIEITIYHEKSRERKCYTLRMQAILHLDIEVKHI